MFTSFAANPTAAVNMSPAKQAAKTAAKEDTKMEAAEMRATEEAEARMILLETMSRPDAVADATREELC
jgi:hypothetical protein